MSRIGALCQTVASSRNSRPKSWRNPEGAYRGSRDNPLRPREDEGRSRTCVGVLDAVRAGMQGQGPGIRTTIDQVTGKKILRADFGENDTRKYRQDTRGDLSEPESNAGSDFAAGRCHR